MDHEFGGHWTEEKLDVMRRYFTAYARALKNQQFQKWYIDAFAGTGKRSESTVPVKEQSALFGEDEADIEKVKDGSVRFALGIDPPFDRYVFVDQSREHVRKLQDLRQEFSGRNIDIKHGDANVVLRLLAGRTNWRNTRAAVFIDPYGMQVGWDTLKALAHTKAVDVALLFPTGPINRMLTRNGVMPVEWAERIDSHLGALRLARRSV
jgi:three-Cys-motif partner protein